MKRIAIAAILLAAAMGAGYILTEAAVTKPGGGTGHLFFQARKGEATRSIAHRLEAEGVVESSALFEVEVRFRHRGQMVRAGEYKIQKETSIRQVAEQLISGKVWERPVTIREGLTIAQIAAEVEKAGIIPAAGFMAAAADLAAEMKKEGFPVPSLEGYLFPETYSFPKSATPRAVVKAMVEMFRRRAALALPKEVALDPKRLHELVTLASIIEKETGAGFERPLISAVFHNRLKIHMPLQSDPTVIYSLPDYDGNIRKKDLSYDSPYNTYRYPGLPPGPIAGPGIESLVAAWRPAEVDYLYFVSMNNGEHRFSRSLGEHNRAVLTFQINQGRK
jgi:UPF0755 protein